MIQERLGIEATLEPTDRSGQFDVMADGKLIASRGGNVATRILLGAGFPDPAQVIEQLARHRG
jgi:hypothetical protein